VGKPKQQQTPPEGKRTPEGGRSGVVQAVINAVAVVVAAVIGGLFVIGAAHVQANNASGNSPAVLNIIFGWVPLPVVATPAPTNSAKPAPTPTPVVNTSGPSPTATRSPRVEMQYLAEVEDYREVASRISDGPRHVNGEDYANSIYAGTRQCSHRVEVEYDLRREWKEFDAQIGVASNSSEDTKVTFQVFLDGEEAVLDPKTDDRQFVGDRLHDLPIKISVRDVLTLKVTAIMVDVDKQDCGGTAVWGDARLTR
jgi:hypothetical protein